MDYTGKFFVGFLYNDKIYKDEYEVEMAIVDEIGGNYNNIDPTETGEYEQVWEYEVEEIWEEVLDVATQIVNDYIEHKKEK